MMEKVTKNHTCSCHIWRDGINKLKSHKFGFLGKGTNCTQVFVSKVLKISQPEPNKVNISSLPPLFEYELGENLVFGNLQ